MHDFIADPQTFTEEDLARLTSPGEDDAELNEEYALFHNAGNASNGDLIIQDMIIDNQNMIILDLPFLFDTVATDYLKQMQHGLRLIHTQSQCRSSR